MPIRFSAGAGGRITIDRITDIPTIPALSRKGNPITPGGIFEEPARIGTGETGKTEGGEEEPVIRSLGFRAVKVEARRRKEREHPPVIPADDRRDNPKLPIVRPDRLEKQQGGDLNYEINQK